MSAILVTTPSGYSSIGKSLDKAYKIAHLINCLIRPYIGKLSSTSAILVTMPSGYSSVGKSR